MNQNQQQQGNQQPSLPQKVVNRLSSRIGMLEADLALVTEQNAEYVALIKHYQEELKKYKPDEEVEKTEQGE